MNNWKRILALAACILPGLVVNAQDTTAATADVMRSNGKIYVVVAVVLTILLGLIVYVVSLDRKISRLEKNAA